MSSFDVLNDAPVSQAKIKVIGVGGGGGNAVEHMIEADIEGVEFICANTDSQALRRLAGKDVVLLQLGGDTTKGLGAGADPNVGRQAALEDRDKLQDAIQDADMLFITSGMGGGTGTGAAPVVAEIAKENKILTVAVVTRPFPFEGTKRSRLAQDGIDELRQQVDSLITIPNEKLLSVLGKGATLMEAFTKANDVLLGAVKGISELITTSGFINVDFADVRTVMSESGLALMGVGAASGEGRALEAADRAIKSPLLDNLNIANAGGILVNVTAGFDITMEEFEAIGERIRELAHDDADVVVGTVIDAELSNELRVTLVATGLAQHADEQKQQQAVKHKHAVAERKVAVGGGAHQAHVPSPVVTTPVKRAAEAETAIERSPYPAPSSPRTAVEKPVAPYAQESAASAEYLDIPAFLRKQAD